MCSSLKSVQFHQAVRALFFCLFCFLILPLVMEAPKAVTLEAGVLSLGHCYCAVHAAGPCSLQPEHIPGRSSRQMSNFRI